MKHGGASCGKVVHIRFDKNIGCGIGRGHFALAMGHGEADCGKIVNRRVITILNMIR